MFIESADDEEDDGTPAMKFERFSVVCAENQLFGEDAQLHFLELESKGEAEKHFEELKDNW